MFGRAILRLVEETACIAALKHVGSNLVTACIDRMDFYHPVYTGDLLRLNSQVNYVHETFMEIASELRQQILLRVS